MTITETIADYICAELHRPLPETVTHHAKRAVIDWFAAMYSGAVQEPNPMLRQALINNDDARQAIIFPDGQYSTVKTAAFLNGASAHTSEFDDIFRDGGFHPGCATIAAALAVGQRHSRPGVMFLRSVVAGYEVSSRISAAMGRDHYRFWHTTGTIATFGATAAAAGGRAALQRGFGRWRAHAAAARRPNQVAEGTAATRWAARRAASIFHKTARGSA